MIYFLDNSLQLQKIVTSKNVISAIHEHELNGLIRGDVELDLSYANKFLVLGIDHVGYYYKDEFYLHKIQRVEYDHVNETATVVLRHIFFEDMIFGKMIRDVRPQNQDALTVSRQTIDANTRWQTIMTDVTGRLSTNFYWQVPYEVIEFMSENYRIEYLPKILFDGQKINGFQLHLANKIGEDKNIRIPYGSRVLDLKYEEDYSEIITKLVVHGKGEEVGDGYGRRIDISNVNFNRNGVKSPVGSLYLEDESITNTYGNDGQTPREGREVFEDIENPNALAEAGYQHYLQVSRPQMLFTADVADIGDVGIGDSVMIIRREYDVYFNARIHKLSVDLLYPEDAQVELGDYKHFKESKISRKTREKNNRVQGQLSDRITRLKREANDRFDNEVAQWQSEYEQALIDVQAEIEADRENMTNLIEGTRNDLTDAINTEVTQAKDYAEQQAQEKADSVQSNLDSFKDTHQQLYDEVTGNVLDIDTFLGDKSKTLEQQFDTVRTDFGTLQTDLDGVESDLTATKSDLQNQLDEARAEFEGLEVGGRNYLENSKERHRNPQNSGNFNFETYYLTQELTGQVTVSGFLEFEEGASNSITISLRDSDYNNILLLTLDIDADGYFEGKADVSQIIHRIYIYMGRIGQTSGNGGYLRLVKIEKGNKATDWTPTPEDTEAKITFLNEQIEFIDGQLSAKLEQTDLLPINNKITEYGNSLTANAQSIQSLIDKTELHDGDITQWSNLTTETAEGLEQTISRVSTAEGKVTKAEADIIANADGLSTVITRVDEAELGIESVSTNLTAEAGKISTLITKTNGHDAQLTDLSIDVDGFKATVSDLQDDVVTGFSEFEQTLDGFSQSVGQMEYDLDYGLSTVNQKYDSISSRVANIKLNTRNLVRGTDFEDLEMFYLYGNATLRNEDGQKSIRLFYQEGFNTASVMFMEYVHLKANEDYFLVVDHRSYSTDEFDYLQLQLEDGSYTRLDDADKGVEGLTNIPATGTDWHQSVIRIRLTESLSGRLRIGTRFDRGTTATGFIDLRNLYLTNTLNREWVPHPRDGQNIDSLVERVSDIEQTADEIRLSVSDSTGLASVLSISSTAMDIISENLNLTGNMNVRGQIESISVSAVRGDIAYLKTNILTSNSIDSNMIQSEVISSVHINVTNALVERIIARNVFANEVNALSLNAVHADLSSVSSRIMESNILKADWIQGGNALLDKVFATSAMFSRMMAKSGFVTALNTVTIDTDQITIRRPDGYQIVNNGVPNWDFSYADTQPRFFSSGSSITGTYYTTSNDVYTTVDATYFQHNTRYVNIRGYAYMYRSTTNPVYGGNVRLSTFGESNNVSNTAYVSSSENSQGSPMFINLTLDLGKPDGSLRQIYTQTKASNSDGYDQIRFRRLLLRFHG